MAKVEVFLPALLRKDKAKSKIIVEASNLKELIDWLGRNGIVDNDKLFDSNGMLRKLINVFINGKLQNDLNAVLNDGDEVSFILAVAGG